MWKNNIYKAKEASDILKCLDTNTKNKALKSINEALINNISIILSENKKDLDNAKDISIVMKKRLVLTKGKILNIASDVLKIAELDDPVGEIIDSYENANKLIIKKVRVPFGVIAAVYESRPNVSVDIAVLCIKTSNACVLKGGKEAINSNRVIVNIIRQAIKDIIPIDSVVLIDSIDRKVTQELLTLKNDIDLVFPRGSAGLINYVVENSRVPYIETGAGICHIYVDENSNIEMAIKIIDNAKTSYPAVCNSLECLLLHKNIAIKILKNLKFQEEVEIRGCEKTVEIIKCKLATNKDYATEYNDLILSVKIVDDIDEAIKHISKFGTHHSDCIISESIKSQEKFMNAVDSSCLYVNASTRFTDGGCFGFGAELGISTQKLHARGPMGLKEMTTYKYKIYGNGQVR